MSDEEIAISCMLLSVPFIGLLWWELVNLIDEWCEQEEDIRRDHDHKKRP